MVVMGNRSILVRDFLKVQHEGIMRDDATVLDPDGGGGCMNLYMC